MESDFSESSGSDSDTNNELQTRRIHRPSKLSENFNLDKSTPHELASELRFQIRSEVRDDDKSVDDSSDDEWSEDEYVSAIPKLYSAAEKRVRRLSSDLQNMFTGTRKRSTSGITYIAARFQYYSSIFVNSSALSKKDAIDRNISRAGMRQLTKDALGESLSEDQFLFIWDQFDARSNTHVSYDEFVSFCTMSTPELIDLAREMREECKIIEEELGSDLLSKMLSKKGTVIESQKLIDFVNERLGVLLTPGEAQRLSNIVGPKIERLRLLLDCPDKMVNDRFYRSWLMEKIVTKISILPRETLNRQSFKGYPERYVLKLPSCIILATPSEIGQNIPDIPDWAGTSHQDSNSLSGDESNPDDLEAENNTSDGDGLDESSNSDASDEPDLNLSNGDLPILEIALSNKKKDSGLVADGFQCLEEPLNGTSILSSKGLYYLWLRSSDTPASACTEAMVNEIAVTHGIMSSIKSKLWSPPSRGFKVLGYIPNRALGSNGKIHAFWYRKQGSPNKKTAAREDQSQKSHVHQLKEQIKKLIRSSLSSEAALEGGTFHSRNLFSHVFTHGDPKTYLTKSQFLRWIRKFHLQLRTRDLAVIFDQLDPHGNGKIRCDDILDFFELTNKELESLLKRTKHYLRSLLKKSKSIDDLFHLLDLDQDGRLSMEDFQGVVQRMNLIVSKNELQRLVDFIDTEKQGWVNESDFRKFLTEKTDRRMMEDRLASPSVRRGLQLLHRKSLAKARIGHESGRLSTNLNIPYAWDSWVKQSHGSKNYLGLSRLQSILRSSGLRLRREEAKQVMDAVDSNWALTDGISYERFRDFVLQQRYSEKTGKSKITSYRFQVADDGESIPDDVKETKEDSLSIDHYEDRRDPPSLPEKGFKESSREFRDETVQIKTWWLSHLNSIKRNRKRASSGEDWREVLARKRALDIHKLQSAAEDAVRQIGHPLGLLERFQEHDQNTTGRIEAKKFRDVLRSVHMYIPSEEQSILAAYIHDPSTDTVKYLKFLELLQGSSEIQCSDLRKLHYRVAKQFLGKDYMFALESFDTVGDGKVSRENFDHALRMCHIKLLPHDWEILRCRLQTQDGSINYLKLKELIETEPVLKYRNNIANSSIDIGSSEKQVFKALLTVKEAEPVHFTVESDQTPTLLSLFEAKDIEGVGCISVETFISAVKEYAHRNHADKSALSETILTCLARKYRCGNFRLDTHRGATDLFVDYMAFFDAFADFTVRSVNMQKLTLELSRKLEAKLSNTGLSFLSAAEKYDTALCGFISRYDLRRVLCQDLALTLVESDLRALMSFSDTLGDNSVDYIFLASKFASSVNRDTQSASKYESTFELLRKHIFARGRIEPHLDLRVICERYSQGKGILNAEELRCLAAELNVYIGDSEARSICAIKPLSTGAFMAYVQIDEKVWDEIAAISYRHLCRLEDRGVYFLNECERVSQYKRESKGNLTLSPAEFASCCETIGLPLSKSQIHMVICRFMEPMTNWVLCNKFLDFVLFRGTRPQKLGIEK